MKEAKPPRISGVTELDRETALKVIVIGASAGGIDALTQVLSRLPAGLSAAVLVVQHLHPDRRTHLHECLARHSPMPVRLADEEMPIEAGVVYLAVPGQHLRVARGRLTFGSGEQVNYVRPSADVLFASAAEAFGPDAIGVILSGTGRDGACGCQKIKAKGGVTIAQDEGTSRHFGMPKSAIEIGAIDYVLPPEEIASKIIALVTPG